MKILYSHRTKSTDGQYVHIDAMTRALTELGHDVLVCGPEGTGRPDELARQLSAGEKSTKGKSWASYLPKAAYETAELGYNLYAIQQLRSALTSFEPDVLYERYTLFHHAGAWMAGRRKLPRLLEVNAPLADERRHHGQLQLYGVGKSSEHRIWQGADAVLPVTEVLADICVEAGVDREKITVIANAVDERTLALAAGEPVRARYGLGADIVLGFVGFVRDWHGVDHVLDWMATGEGAGTKLLLVGDGPAKAELTAQAERLGIADRFLVTGVVQRDAVAEHVAAFDIALQPAVTAYASPLKLQEYMAQARAIIAPDQPNIRETVTDNETALLVDPSDTAALHQALARLSDDGALRDRLGQAAREALIARNMTWKANAQRVIDIAQRLLADDSTRRHETVTGHS